MSRHRAEGPRAPWQEGTRDALASVGLEPQWVRDLVVRALGEDLGPGWVDVTTAATVPVDDDRRAEVVATDDGVVAGLLLWPVVLAEAAARLDLPVPTADLRVHDGARITKGDLLADLRGPTRVLLVAERTALNLMRHLSGVATHAADWVAALAGTGTRLLDTRCTTPGLRPLERYAVRCGGGTNGRAGLYDAAHVSVDHAAAAGSVAGALDAVRRRLPGALVQIDVQSSLQGVEAVHAGARFIVCEGMSLDQLPGTVTQIRAATAERVEIACSGGFGLAQAAQVARAGVDHVYVDSLVQEARALDAQLRLY